MIKIKLPIKLVSEANNYDHWRSKHKRKKKNENLLLLYWPRDHVHLPCKVILTRVAPRKFDYDNLVHACKYLYDKICDKLRPGLAPGQADNTDLISVEYRQVKGGVKEYAVIIEVIQV